MNILPINFNNVYNYKPSFKSNFSKTEPTTTSTNADKKREIDAEIMQSKGKAALTSAKNIQMIGERKLKEAQRIFLDWQEKKPTNVIEKNSTKEYLTSWGEGLKLFIEKRNDGTERTIKYMQGEVCDITETDSDGKTYIYSFYKNKLAKFTKARHTIIDERNVIELTPNEFLFTASGDLRKYRENYRTIKAYNRSQELLGSFATIGVVLDFAIENGKTYLENAKKDIFISSSGKRFIENEFTFDKNGKLVK